MCLLSRVCDEFSNCPVDVAVHTDENTENLHLRHQSLLWKILPVSLGNRQPFAGLLSPRAASNASEENLDTLEACKSTETINQGEKVYSLKLSVIIIIIMIIIIIKCHHEVFAGFAQSPSSPVEKSSLLLELLSPPEGLQVNRVHSLSDNNAA